MTKARREFHTRLHGHVFDRFEVFCKRCNIPQIGYKNKSANGEVYYNQFGAMRIEYIAEHKQYYRIFRLDKPDLTKQKYLKLTSEDKWPKYIFNQITGKTALNKQDLYCFFRIWELSYQHYKAHGEHKC